MVKRVLVTGATGFLGRHVLSSLAAMDVGELHATSRMAPPVVPAGPVWHAVDLLDPAAAQRLIAEVRPTHLLHAAWEATPVGYASSPENLRWLTAGVALLDAFGASGGQRFVGVGSSAEYAASDGPCIEDVTPVSPASVYGHAKAAMAEAVRASARLHGFPLAWGRVFLPYGPGDPPGRLIPSLVSAFRAGHRLPLSDGGQLRDFIHVEDAGRMLAALLLSPAEGFHNIGTGEPVSIRQVVELVATHCAVEGLADFGALPRRSGEPAMLVADMRRTFAVSGMPRPRTITEGLKRMFTVD